MDREQGFYWVSEGEAEPEIALWQDGAWWTIGCEEPSPSGLIHVLGRVTRARPGSCAGS